MTSPSKYTRDDRKHIAELIENLNNADDYVEIFKIFTSDSEIASMKNSNGVFLNLSTASDSTLSKIKRYLRKSKNNKVAQSEVDIDVIPNGCNTKSDRTYKLSNYEKNMLKQRNLKKIMNDVNDYEELKIAPKKKQTSRSASKN